jgi:two-component system, NtrC family, sensor histidine kinase HydH
MDGPADRAATSFPQILDQCLVSAVVAIDQQHRIVAFTAEAESLIRLPASQALYQHADILPPSLAEVILETMLNGEAVRERQMILTFPTEGDLTVRVSTTPMRDAQGKCVGAIAVLNNITSARRLDEKLQRIDRLASIGTLAASMAHEVKNAMVAVKTFAELLIKQNKDTRLAEIVVREMHRIDSIVSQMLRFSGPARPSHGVIHLHDVLEQSLSLVQHHLEGRKIKLTRSFKASPDTLSGDPYQLEQAFINLFFNALEAMGPDGELQAATEFVPKGGPDAPNAPILRVTIHDSGMGIAPENLKRLFEPFFTTKPTGTGLGLPITQRIVQEHNGLMSVASELQQGTTFTLLLPSASKQF